MHAVIYIIFVIFFILYSQNAYDYLYFIVIQGKFGAVRNSESRMAILSGTETKQINLPVNKNNI
jgi:hypothetical protein